MAVTLDQIRKVYASYFAPDYTGQLDEKLIKTILDLYSKKVGGRTEIAKILNKPPYNLTVDQVVVGRILTKARDKKLVKKVPISEYKTVLAQKIYESPADRKIYNTIREVREIDRITTQKSKTGKLLRAPSWAKYKVVYATPENLETTVIPKKFQGANYYKTLADAQKALDERLVFSGKDVRKIPFEKAVKKLHGLALKDSEVLSNFNKLAQEMYGVAKNTQELLPKQKWLAQDLIKYREFLLGFTPIKDLAAPTAVQLNEILFEFPGESKYRKYGSEAVRQSKLRIRDQLLKTKGPKLRVLRDNIIKYSNTVGRELDEAMGVSATFERAPGYTELGQLIAEKANQAKMSEIDAPFSRIFQRVVEGNRGPINVLKNKYNTLDEAIKDFNKVSKNFQKTWKVDTPIIEFKPGQKLNPKDFIKHFDKLSKEAKANVTQLAEKGIGLRSRAMPMIEMLYGIYKKSEGADKIAIQTILGCRKAAESGGRIGFAAGTLDVCVNTKLTNQTLESGQKIVAGIEEGATGVLGKMRNAARGFLGALGKFGPKVGKYGAVVAAGALAQPAVDLVRQFMNDDPTTYLTDPDQQAGMLLATLEAQERPKPRNEILDWGIGAGAVGATAATIPGTRALWKARRLPTLKRAGMGMPRAAMGPLMKYISGMYTPAGLLATEPLRIAQKRSQGEGWGEIAKDPTMWMGPAFAPGMTRLATAGMKSKPLLAKALRLGMSKPALKLLGRTGGYGLLASLGLTGYDKYQDWKNKRGWFAKD